MIDFYKYHGLGNDFIIIDNREEKIKFEKDTIRALCHRNFGIGADGILLAENSKDFDVKMVIYNSDGSSAEMCGNATRCFAKYLYEKGIIKKKTIHIETLAGEIIPEIQTENDKVMKIKVDMGKPAFDPKAIPCNIECETVKNIKIKIGSAVYDITAMLMGVPHAVIFKDELADSDIIREGKQIEESSFFPLKTNVNFVKILSRSEIILRTWERGAGYTQACGTGSCASVAAGIVNDLLDNRVLVHLRGGDLIIEWDGQNNIYMEGTAKEVFSGKFDFTAITII
ncbi:diaminopimelate epimerase [Lutispora saccharofermentans]|uniref:Diaminopimelate epimerase n=1 Tax=Lutispora saccharofermentans TaxID=3024236 RepID=A0ABT1NAE2_9FIRM|nr:diaminopimelate epimerase [Lutispora saccharofermentans]MCQ1528071.1 diaminopimelate epimerase [Lutispora saccharofermentans]